MFLSRMIGLFSTKHSRLHKALGNERGAAAVEFALVTPAFLIMVIGIVDFSRVFWIKSSMQFAVEQTARYAMVNPDDTIAELEDHADIEIAKVDLDGVTFTATSSTVDDVSFRTITGTCTFKFLIPAADMLGWVVDLSDVVIQAQSITPVNDS